MILFCLIALLMSSSFILIGCIAAIQGAKTAGKFDYINVWILIALFSLISFVAAIITLYQTYQ